MGYQLCIEDDDGQEIVEIMGDAGRQPADSGQALLFIKLSLHQPLSEDLLLILLPPLLGTLGKLPHNTMTPMTKSVKPV